MALQQGIHFLMSPWAGAQCFFSHVCVVPNSLFSTHASDVDLCLITDDNTADKKNLYKLKAALERNGFEKVTRSELAFPMLCSLHVCAQMAAQE